VSIWRSRRPAVWNPRGRGVQPITGRKRSRSNPSSTCSATSLPSSRHPAARRRRRSHSSRARSLPSRIGALAINGIRSSTTHVSTAACSPRFGGAIAASGARDPLKVDPDANAPDKSSTQLHASGVRVKGTRSAKGNTSINSTFASLRVLSCRRCTSRAAGEPGRALRGNRASA